MTEHFFTSWDGTRLFYRAWLPQKPAERAVVLFHRGHEHSGRLVELVRHLGLEDFAIFAWDARGHGKSPGERGWAESFAALVRDADCFVRHVSTGHAIAMENVAVVAHSVGAVIAAAWVHDYGPPVRAMVLASPALRVKLYVPFALPFLRLRRKLRKKAFVTSYVRPGMLTHDKAEAESYARDPMISRSVSLDVLVEMHDTAMRLLEDAGTIRTPTLVLSSGKDFVVRLSTQRQFFRRLGSPIKEIREYHGAYHDLWHEVRRERPIAHTRDFILRAFGRPPVADAGPGNQAEYERLAQQPSPMSAAGLAWAAQRVFLKSVGKLSAGIRLGWKTGFDSGDSLDYVYRNRAGGTSFLGRFIDRIYLNSPGWRGIRMRREHLQTLLRQAIGRVSAGGKCVHIFDPAAGRGRYVLDTVSGLAGVPVRITLRDWSRANVDAAARMARQKNLAGVSTSQGDAFDRRALAGVEPQPHIAIVSGLYELFPDNERVRESLAGLADAIPDGGLLIYTNQPWHPQLEMIARVLDNHEGKPWVMRCRPQAEMDTLVRAAGFEKLEMLMDPDGIFTVSLARRTARAADVWSENGELERYVERESCI
jgi:alpha-beta hydrolase superfamily lysophospholipase